MNKKRFCSYCIFALCAVLIFFVLYLAPKLINSYLDQESFKRDLQEYFAQEINQQVRFEKITFSLFPAPHIEIQDPKVDIDSKWGAVNAPEMQVYPHILPLFRGEWKSRKLLLLKPKWILPNLNPLELIDFNPEKRLSERFESSLKSMSLPADSLLLSIEQGSVSTKSGKYAELTLRDVSLRAVAVKDNLQVDFKAGSNICKSLSLEADFNLKEKAGSAELFLEKMEPKLMLNEYLRQQAWNVQECVADLRLGITWKGRHHWQGDMLLELPLLHFSSAKQSFRYPEQYIKFGMDTDPQALNLNLQDSKLLESGLQLKGNIRYRHDENYLQSELSGKQGNISQVRKLALVVAGKQKAVQNTFAVLKNGNIPDFKIKLQGKSWKAAADINNWVVNGHLKEGWIFVPGMKLHLGQTRGEAKMENGILRVRDISSSYGQTSIHNGSLDLDMKSNPLDLSVSTSFQANLAQLPDLLKNVLRGEQFADVLQGVTEINGKAEGELRVKGPVTGLKVATQVPDFQLQVRHKKLPVALDVAQGDFALNSTAISVQDIQASLGNSTFSDFKGTWRYAQNPMLDLESGQSKLSMSEVYRLAGLFVESDKEGLTLKSLEGEVVLSKWGLRGPPAEPSAWEVQAKGAIEKILLYSPYLPKGLTLKKGIIDWQKREMSIRDCSFSFLDSKGQMGMEAVIEKDFLSALSLSLKANIQDEVQDWLFQKLPLPTELKLNTPLEMNNFELKWEANDFTQVNSTIRSPEDNFLEFNVKRSSKGLELDRLLLKDKFSEAKISASWRNASLRGNFSGKLEKKTLDGLLRQNEILQGELGSKDLNFRVDLENPMQTRILGDLQGQDIVLPLAEALIFKNLELEGNKERLNLKAVHFEFAEKPYTLEGQMAYKEQGGDFALQLKSSNSSWHYLQSIANKISSNSKGEKRNLDFLADLQGHINVVLDEFTYKNYSLRPLECDIKFTKKNEVNISLLESKLCGLDLDGQIDFSPAGLDLSLKSSNQQKELKPIITCLFTNSSLITGTFDFEAEVQGEGPVQEFRDSLKGSFNLQGKNGRVQRWGLLAKIFSMLNVAELFQGKLPDLKEEGFAYDSLESSGVLLKGRSIDLKRTIIKGPSMTLVFEGDIDLKEETLDMQLLVAPLRTVDWFVEKLPIVKDILGGTLVAVPVRVQGKWSDPSVVPLSPSAVGSRVVDILTRTLKLPAKLIHPFFPQDTKDKNDKLKPSD